ncbi:DUF1679 domain-containing protein [Flammeovirga pectinis]|uniref:DUF1679 domain-containing protein n=1 Tax=Flammeovirga pectinis TaxID=2494373 RepID=A0A3S9PB96_9BACT|nr:oxidoreductase family protein [Flammeovirga pectinis]AZQ65511.1 DUF1679 domain-containing protein [Flammeovirga pectinis]
MNQHFKDIILESTASSSLKEVEVIQSLWSGYGSIIRYSLKGGSYKSVVVKHVQYPDTTKHPRGWNTNLSHERKLKSYNVETAWYKEFSQLCDTSCRIPKCFALETHKDEVLIVLEDLDSSGFPERLHQVGWDEITCCLEWLANFHASFMGKKPSNLWEIGTYWHLSTRPDELIALEDKPLKKIAQKLDDALNNAKYLTLVHGDAKLANFCFSTDGKKVAAVDFQYVGGGCGMKDVVYFIGSCLNEEECEHYEDKLLTIYFDALKEGLKKHNPTVDFLEIEKEWRALFPIAWTDFHRFLKGWSPGHWKINSYSEKMAQSVIKSV